MFRKLINDEIKRDSIVVAKTLPPQRICQCFTLIFMASQIFDIASTIQVLWLVTIVSMMNNDFDDTR